MSRRYRKRNDPTLFIFVVCVIGGFGLSSVFSDQLIEGMGVVKLMLFIVCSAVIVGGCGWLIHLIYRSVKQRIRAQNLAALHAHHVEDMRGIEFEIFLEHLFTSRGYKVKMIGGSGDGGVDLIISKGKEKISVQAKGYKNKVNRLYFG